MDKAIIFAAGKGLNSEDLSLFGEKRFGGNPQIKRLVITAQRAGIDNFIIVTDKDDPTPEKNLEKELKKDRRITSRIHWHVLGSPLDLNSEPYLVLPSNLLTTPQGLENLVKYSTKDDEVASLVEENPGPQIKTDGNGGGEEVFQNGGRIVGAFKAEGNLIKEIIDSPEPLNELIKNALHRKTLKAVKFSNGYWMRLNSDANSAKEAEDLMFEHVSKSSSGWLSKNIHSKLSIPISRLLIKTPLTPNMISGIIGCIGMLSGLFYVIGNPIIGALCLEFATIIDRCDGEVARVKLMETKYGQWVDTIFDQFSYLSFVLGVPIGLYLTTQSDLAIILGSINLVIFTFFQFWTIYFLINHAKSGSMVAYSPRVDEMIPLKERTLLYRFIVKLRPFFKREVFSLVFLIAAIIGGYKWVLVLTTLGLGFAFIHQIDDMIKLFQAKYKTEVLNKKADMKVIQQS